jgi:uncharacterized protein (DUF952 family)
VTSRLVYKVLRRAEWMAAQVTGVFTGSPADARDGFIHLSAAHQVRGVCERHFTGEDDLVLLTIEENRLGPALKWETSHKGEAYPHLYGTLPLALVASVAEIRRGTDGRLTFPSEIA